MVDPCENCIEIMNQFELNSVKFVATRSNFFTQVPKRPQTTIEEAHVGFTTTLKQSVRRRKGWTYTGILKKKMTLIAFALAQNVAGFVTDTCILYFRFLGSWRILLTYSTETD